MQKKLTLTNVTAGSLQNSLSISLYEDPSNAGTFIMKVKDTSSGSAVELRSYSATSLTDMLSAVNLDSEQLFNAAAGASADSLGQTQNDPNKLVYVGPTVHGTEGGGNLSATILVGNVNDQTGLHSFDVVDDINIVLIPDAAYQGGADSPNETLLGDVIKGAYGYCESRGDCFFIADSPSGKKPTEIKTFRQQFNSSYGAIYYPWVKITDPRGGFKFVPPSAAMAGVYSHTDIEVGVHKAPAGRATGTLKSISGLERIVTHGEQGVLNPLGVNVIRQFEGAGNVSWGARTMAADPEWRYINVRRLFLFIEESIDEGTRWVVFEPNTPKLWGAVKRNLTAFLTSVWRDGALFGNVAEEAFYIKIDESNNGSATRDLGILNIEIGVAPAKPAEFVVIRISQKTAES